MRLISLAMPQKHKIVLLWHKDKLVTPTFELCVKLCTNPNIFFKQDLLKLPMSTMFPNWFMLYDTHHKSE